MLTALVLADLLGIVVRWGTSAYQSLFHSPLFERLEPVKLLDPLLVLGFSLMLLLHMLLPGRQRQPAWLAAAVGAIGLVSAVAVIGAIYTPPGPYYALQSYVFLLRPVLLWVLFRRYPPRRRVYRRRLRLAVAFGAASALVALYQAISPGQVTWGDQITGLFLHSHAQAMFGFALVLLLLAFPEAFGNRLVRAAVVGLLLAGALLGRNDKATLLFVALCLAGVLLLSLFRRRLILTLLALGLLAGAGGAVVSRSSELRVLVRRSLVGNLDELLVNYGASLRRVAGDVGLVQMVNYYGQRAAQDPVIAMAGFGPGNFGSPGSLAKFAAGMGYPWQQAFFAWDVDFDRSRDEPRLQAISYHTSLAGVALGELGVLGALPFAALVLQPLLHRQRGQPASLRRRRVGLKLAYALLLGVSMVATASSAAWENELVMTLIMAGLSVPGQPPPATHGPTA